MYSSLAWLEATAPSVWLRESPSLWAFPFVLILHTVGMGFLAGTNVAMDLRVGGEFAFMQPSVFGIARDNVSASYRI
jgi:hypothetical protein